MALAVKYAGTPLPKLTALSGLVIVELADATAMARLQNKEIHEIAERFNNGHRAYVAFLNGEPSAFGWIAMREAYIGELRAHFKLAHTDCYLWNFVTLPQFRGRGIYPRLLTAILTDEEWVERFWIAYAPENRASASGILKAGFQPVADLSFDDQDRPAVYGLVPGGGSLASRVLGLPEAEGLSECWRCIRAGKLDSTCRTGACCCDYQVPEIVC
jgi:GNAT superfamily N-acetyltransferase